MYQKQRTTKSYSITSPYMELLQSKKRVYGLKYHSSVGSNNSHSKSTNNQNIANLNTSSVKNRPASSSVASHHNKSNIKSNSSQKAKSTKTQNTKKKRIYTEQAQNFNEISSDPKLHESLFINMDRNPQINQLASKSLFTNQNPQAIKNNYINNFDFLKKFSQFNTQLKDKQIEKQQYINFSGSKSQKSNKSTKSKGKVANNKNHNRSTNFESINVGKSIEQLGLIQVQDLICLIDNCVEQANEYISFLAAKVQSLKNQVMKCKTQQFQLQRIIKQKNQQIDQKDQIILKLKKQIETIKNQKQSCSNNNNSASLNGNQQYKSKEMKKILEVLNEINQQNHFLQSKVRNLEEQLNQQRRSELKKYNSNPIDLQEQDYINMSLNNNNINNLPNSQIKNKLKQHRKSSNNKDIYNEIHSKIDILNISIDNNNNSKKQGQSSGMGMGGINNLSNVNGYVSNSLNYGSQQISKSDGKKYKFLKTKNGNNR